MAAETNIKSASITNLGSTPMILNTAGVGAKTYDWSIDDYVSVAATPIQSAGSYYRVLRIPTRARIKSLTVFTDKALDSGTPTLAFDIGIAFSDSTTDGTPVAFQGLVPTTANDMTMTTFASYSSPNKIFGGITAAALTNSAAYPPTQQVFKGITSGYTMAKLMTKPLYEIFGFTDARGMVYDPGGMFDIYAYATTGANTGVAGTLGMRCQFVA